jgi:hypothetical protein
LTAALQWFGEQFPPHGALAAEGFSRLLGRPSLDPLTVLVRETGEHEYGGLRRELDQGAERTQPLRVRQAEVQQDAPRRQLHCRSGLSKRPHPRDVRGQRLVGQQLLHEKRITRVVLHEQQRDRAVTRLGSWPGKVQLLAGGRDDSSRVRRTKRIVPARPLTGLRAPSGSTLKTAPGYADGVT